jgi:hypothetical protein
MEVRSGHRAGTSAELHCKDCPYVVMVARGDVVPPCPCGADVYEKVAPEVRHRSAAALRKKTHHHRTKQDAA